MTRLSEAGGYLGFSRIARGPVCAVVVTIDPSIRKIQMSKEANGSV